MKMEKVKHTHTHTHTRTRTYMTLLSRLELSQNKQELFSEEKLISDSVKKGGGKTRSYYMARSGMCT